MTKNKSAVEYMLHLDGIRALAVGGVIAEHWASGLPRSLRELVLSFDLGGLGVECFFVLSGFLITLILLDSKDQNRPFKYALGHFYVRRLLRIFPAYYAALLALFFLYPDMREALGWHALYLSNLYPLWHDSFAPIGGHFWSLAVEEQFYLFWPLIVLVLPMKKVMYVALAGCLIAPISRFVLWQTMGEGHVSVATVTTTALDLLCFGAFLACIKHQVGLPVDSVHTRRLKTAGLFALALYLVLYFQVGGVFFGVFGRTLTALFFGALIVAAANGFKGPARLIFGNRIIVWLGTISYGLYIFHGFIPAIYLHLLDTFDLSRDVFGTYYIRYPVLIAFLMIVTTASYYFLERPVRQYRKYFL